MTALIMGGNAPLPGEAFDVSVRWKQTNTAIDEIDVSAFILTATGKVSSDDDMIFYGQRESGGGAIRMTEISASAPDGTSESIFEFDLRKLPATADKIAVSGTIADAQAKRVSFSGLASLVVSIIQGGSAVITFDVPVTGMSEAALILGEFYKRNGQSRSTPTRRLRHLPRQQGRRPACPRSRRRKPPPRPPLSICPR